MNKIIAPGGRSQQIFFCEKIQFFCRSVWESFPFCRIVQDFFLFLGCFSFVASESSFFVGQTFWSSLSFFVGMLTFGCLTPNEPELIDNFGCNRWP
ncbi:uncharacterized protein OCT59_029083 [Rhizophagus irregularis]|uniref:uncharacterized protein n=1 Tax=Rhizophagus irregularis TaxID=588596 RepID=UPI00332357E2|nr:hypothetical protein OCT59_029083 [Rhizophagus irregularis]